MKQKQNIFEKSTQSEPNFFQSLNPFFGIPKFEREVSWFVVAVAVVLTPIIYSIFYVVFPMYYFDINIFIGFWIFSTFLTLFVRWLIFGKEKKKTVFEKNKRFFDNIPLIFLVLLFLWATIGLFFSTDLVLSLTGKIDGVYVEEGYFQYLAYALIFLCFFNLKNQQTKLWLMRLFVLVATICAMFSIIDPGGKFVPGFSENTYKYSAMFINPNHSGYYMCMAALAAVMLFVFESNLVHKILLSVFFVIILLFMFLNGSMGPNLAVFVALASMGVFVWIKRKKFSFPLLVFLLSFLAISICVDTIPFLKKQKSNKDGFVVELLAIFDEHLGTNLLSLRQVGTNTEGINTEQSVIDGADGHDRFDMWKICFENAKEKPFFGTGIGTFGTYNQGRTTSFRPHNEFLQIMSQMGILALVFYLSSLFILIIFSFKNKLTKDSFIAIGAMTAYLISAFFGNSVPHVMPAFLMFFAFALSGVFSQSRPKVTIDKTKENNIMK